MKKFIAGTSNIFGRLFASLPGKRFGVYRSMPVFFVLGAVLEYSMIHWHAGSTNFYEVYKRKEALKLARKQLMVEGIKEKYLKK